ncbi:MAG TPA: VWA domain-containing protein [Pyrinomonadaceae bacterium]|nr:VWA domain-containing protein [Pyrinomonadaceae bacterium]
MTTSDSEEPENDLDLDFNSETNEPGFDKARSAERQSFLKLTRELASLPLDQSTAVVETSAAIAGVSLRAAIEYLRSAAAAAQVLAAPELRTWGELGRRLAMSDVEGAVTFFAGGVETIEQVPEGVRPAMLQLCSRQITLSIPIALHSFQQVPALAKAIDDADVLRSILETAAEISRRSAKHSAEFLNQTSTVIDRLREFKDPAIARQGLALAAEFAVRAGGIAADAWAALPSALSNLKEDDALRLLENTIQFLERGGGSALQVLVTGGEILRTLPEVFEEWVKLLWTVAQHGNASLVAFVRSSTRFVRSLTHETDRSRIVDLATRVMKLTGEIAETDGEAALACFRSSSLALRTVSIDQFEQWARQGLSSHQKDARARRSYFALETRGSHHALRSGSTGLSLDEIRHLLVLYVEGLTGREVEISALAAVPVESRIGDGHTIHLPSLVAEFGDDELDFRLFKVLAAHGAGQIEFGTYENGTPELRAAYAALSETYDAENVDALDSFAIADELLNVGQTSRSVRESSTGKNACPTDADELLSVGQTSRSVDEPSTGKNACPTDLDYRNVLHLFPHSQLARRIFGTLENCRIDFHLRQTYRGLSRDLDLIREHLRRSRPSVTTLPAALLPFELLFQSTLLGGATDDARQYYGQIVSELETLAAEYLSNPQSTVADSLMATSRVYSLFQSLTQGEDAVQQMEVQEEPSDQEEENAIATESFNRTPSNRKPERRDARELFNAWNDPGGEGEPDELAGAEAWTEAELPEQVLEEGEVAYNYDEWDRDLTDHRLGWCRVVEKQVKHGDRMFVDQTRERHKGVISSIRHQFQLMKPEDLLRVTNELDGEEFDLSAVVDYVIDRRADGQQSERLYTKRLRRRRDVAVSFLLDQSSSTARTIGRHPLQPYTRPGRRIIEIEKEGLVLMSEALEAVGDVYAINGFTSEGRRNVKFYVVKDFDEKYSDEVKRRIGGITFQNNTRLGAAIRHATAKLAKQQARTRLLIVLSDGRPYDHDYGDARYAREDTREALRQAKNQGITPFCITIDRESEAELRDLYGEIGYTIIDDVLSLPERMPGIYRRLTT